MLPRKTTTTATNEATTRKDTTSPFGLQQPEALRQAEHLFDTLPHRAFRGEFGAGDADLSDVSSAGCAATTAATSDRSAATIGEAGGELTQMGMNLP